MPRYFFNIEEPDFSPNNEGVEMMGPERARDQAVTAAGEMLKDIDGSFWNGPRWRMNVTDAEGSMVCVLTVSGVTTFPT